MAFVIGMATLYSGFEWLTFRSALRYTLAATATWKPATARIVSSQHVFRRRGGSYWSSRYTYIVAGKSYTSTRARFFGNRTSVGREEPGKLIDIFVDPADPGESVRFIGLPMPLEQCERHVTFFFIATLTAVALTTFCAYGSARLTRRHGEQQD